MSFMDEKIARIINEAEQSMAPRSILAGPVKIGDRYYEFTPQTFFEDKLSVYFPRDFVDLPEHLRKVKYPYEQRPEIIKSDEPGSVDFSLKRIDHDLEDELVEELTTGMKAMIQRMNPTHVFYESGIEEVGDKPIGFFEFKSTVTNNRKTLYSENKIRDISSKERNSSKRAARGEIPARFS
ncbi:hypothetical protein EHV15_17230 [Paenibacillus oralis]|uniref:Uncharacterized protein n=1 Tax=Paenibacillus oralis TaxID=2490856 RepID=A0A3P3U2V5_9BACL|nr:hypothetical protein [Paenibacillus oralis]RRJ64470.1 hypothetical protein EHV15_17230 [Paenibacillus oralis]